MSYHLSDVLRELADHLDLPPKKTLVAQRDQARTEVKHLREETTHLKLRGNTLLDEISVLKQALDGRPSYDLKKAVREELHKEFSEERATLRTAEQLANARHKKVAERLSELIRAVEQEPSASAKIVEIVRKAKRSYQ